MPGKPVRKAPAERTELELLKHQIYDWQNRITAFEREGGKLLARLNELEQAERNRFFERMKATGMTDPQTMADLHEELKHHD
jgi:hypothetical protein